ncbi:hypothetical protein VMCG_06275 [Cytospora schulzeri]|uniref:Xylanolytic transcriptional activator regulatory domain-containing protein n=1 Tax=Cytospora schulzeri TaxID=448051 RepID=A0A423W9F3_9PEZI|nr:hypothetical protein VMCG_06275 [Valsa malicola]
MQPMPKERDPGSSSGPVPFRLADTIDVKARQDVFTTSNGTGTSSPGKFACEVTAAIDARLGLPSMKKHCPVPLTDAPLFGSLSPRRQQPVDPSFFHADNLLPPRKHADRMVDIYWRYIQPLEPVLDQDRFSRSYQALFDGAELGTDERIFVSTLNTVFALSTQLQESTQPEQREEAGKTFFHRAWSLLRPETIIWEPGSLELVQCLLLLSRFLQCTNNPHQTWMAVGSAVRIAQSLGLHVPEPPSGLASILGRNSMVPLIASSPTVDLSYMDNGSDLPKGPLGASLTYLTKTLEVYDFSNYILPPQAPANSHFAQSLGLPQSYQGAELSTAVQIDACLKKWEKGLPSSIGPESDQRGATEGGLDSQQILLLQLRLAHVRTLLFRPMLAQLCLPQCQAGRTPPSADQGLGARVMQDCASLCVENSRKMVDLVCDNCSPGDAATIGLLPWWYRIFFLYVASQHLIAAMLRPDVLPVSMVSESLDKALSVLCAHEHLSPCVGRCVRSFQALAQKISDIHQLAGDRVPVPGGSSNAFFQGVFQDLGFEAESSLLRVEDMSWLDVADWNA